MQIQHRFNRLNRLSQIPLIIKAKNPCKSVLSCPICVESSLVCTFLKTSYNPNLAIGPRLTVNGSRAEPNKLKVNELLLVHF